MMMEMSETDTRVPPPSNPTRDVQSLGGPPEGNTRASLWTVYIIR